MKKILILIVLCVTLNSNAQVNIYNYTNYNQYLYTTTLIEGCKILQLDSIDIFICYSKFDNALMQVDSRYKAAFSKISDKQFAINIDTDYNVYDRQTLIHILLHELYHIKQVIKDNLILTKYVIYYKDIKYTYSSKYEDRVFEIEAEEFATKNTNIIYKLISN